MVDVENSMSRSVVSRRKLLTGAATVPLFPSDISPSRESPEVSVPIISFWQEWQSLHARATSLCQRWQDIETHLMRSIGAPQVVISSSDNSTSFRAQSHAEIDQALARLPRSPEIATALHADFSNQRARWDAEAEALGFDDIERQEEEAWRNETKISEAIFATQATSPVGIAIKIALIVELCSTGPNDQEFPWPQLRAVLAEIEHFPRSRASA